MQHRAGLLDYGTLADYRNAVVAKRHGRLLPSLLRVRAETLVFEPGQGWNYSNVGYYSVGEFWRKLRARRWAIPLRALGV
jgi:CubicO group peptidase (beta-lactamase class C family)